MSVLIQNGRSWLQLSYRILTKTYENNQRHQAKGVWEDLVLYNTRGLFVNPALLSGMP